MVTSDDVRRVLAPLPRSYEVEVRGRWKFRVGQIVYVAFSRDEQAMGFGFARTEREGLIASDPGTFFLPPASDLRFQWVCAHLAPLEAGEMRELVVDAWRMCTPKMLHELPELPTQAMAAWSLIEERSWSEVKPLLHPHLQFTDRTWSISGRAQLLAALAERPTPRPPTSVEIREGQIFRWQR